MTYLLDYTNSDLPNNMKHPYSAMTRPKRDERLVCVIAFGSTQGKPHKNKPIESLYETDGSIHKWFHKSMDAVILAPTESNRQNFFFTLSGSTVADGLFPVSETQAASRLNGKSIHVCISDISY